MPSHSSHINAIIIIMNNISMNIMMMMIDIITIPIIIRISTIIAMYLDAMLRVTRRTLMRMQQCIFELLLMHNCRQHHRLQQHHHYLHLMIVWYYVSMRHCRSTVNTPSKPLCWFSLSPTPQCHNSHPKSLHHHHQCSSQNVSKSHISQKNPKNMCNYSTQQ